MTNISLNPHYLDKTILPKSGLLQILIEPRIIGKIKNLQFYSTIGSKMSLIYVVIASIFAAAVNYCLRKNSENQTSSQGYLSLYFLCSFAISFLLIEVNFKSFSFVMSFAGIAAGCLNFVMMNLFPYCLRQGPSGLSFAFQNSACIVPPVLLYLIFGSSFGFNLSLPAISGLCLIVLGLFISSWLQKGADNSHRSTFMKWCVLVILILFIQGIILTLFQWRCLLLTTHPESHTLIPWKCTLEEEAWFMPGFFLIPTLLQTSIFGLSEKRWFNINESILGITAGVLNGAAMFFLLIATKEANMNEKVILFPLFAVSVIFLCNLWGENRLP